MQIQLSDLAAAKLHWLLYEERKNSDHPLAIHIIPLTSGCNSPTFALEITDVNPTYETATIKGVPFVWQEDEAAWMDGLIIDLNRENGKFSIEHPHPPFMPACPFE
jgi:Fe-S cluster assembly iron-binding protein IscA